MSAEVPLLSRRPEVARIHGALTAQSRLIALRCLLERPMTFAELSERIGISATGVREALRGLDEAGYLVDESAEGRQRRSSSAPYSVKREMVLRDLGELFVYLAL